MKHPPSKTIGKKLWLAKASSNANALCPLPAVHLRRGEYSFSPANFDPRRLSLENARETGNKTTLSPPYGRIFGAQIWRMAHEAKIGDIIFLESENRNIHAWGRINAEYDMRAFKPLKLKDLMEGGLHRIGVEWHELEKVENTFNLGRGDKLLFREVDKSSQIYSRLETLLKLHPPTEIAHPTVSIPHDEEYEEGGKRLRKHLLAERDASASRKAKELARSRSKDGKLSCEACGSIPENDYEGLDIIEAHHSNPLANGKRQTKHSDFKMLCPCCHRAVHKLIDKGVHPLSAIDKLKSYLK